MRHQREADSAREHQYKSSSAVLFNIKNNTLRKCTKTFYFQQRASLAIKYILWMDQKFISFCFSFQLVSALPVAKYNCNPPVKLAKLASWEHVIVVHLSQKLDRV